MDSIMIKASGLTKGFGEVLAVDEVSFEVGAGEVFGFLGPNGAGKTTTVRMLTALISPTQGEAEVAGFQIGKEDDQIRRKVGILTESPGLYDRLSAERNLSFFANLYEIENVSAQVEKYLRMLGLWDRRSEEVGGFSKGMRQKLAIARALLHEPRVLFLDEPTSGLDPAAARMVREFISELRQEGRTIFMCTHNLDEADRLCDRVAVINSRLLAVDDPAALRKRLYGRVVVLHLVTAREPYAEAIREYPFVHSVEAIDTKLVVSLEDPEMNNPVLIRRLVEMGAEIQFIGEVRRTLEDVYLRLMETPNTTGG
jgi:ABC-2 type transport system ATP-binding protein